MGRFWGVAVRRAISINEYEYEFNVFNDGFQSF